MVAKQPKTDTERNNDLIILFVLAMVGVMMIEIMMPAKVRFFFWLGLMCGIAIAYLCYRLLNNQRPVTYRSQPQRWRLRWPRARSSQGGSADIRLLAFAALCSGAVIAIGHAPKPVPVVGALIFAAVTSIGAVLAVLSAGTRQLSAPPPRGVYSPPAQRRAA